MASTNDNMDEENFRWTNEYVVLFREICIKYIRKHGRGLMKWKEIKEEFEAPTKRKIANRSLKNKWDAMKKEWRTWKQLKREETGLRWDPSTHKISGSDEWWEKKIKLFEEENRESEQENRTRQGFEDMLYSQDNQHSSQLHDLEVDESSFWNNFMSEVNNCSGNQDASDTQVPRQSQGNNVRKFSDTQNIRLKPTQMMRKGRQSGGAAILSNQLDSLISNSNRALHILISDSTMNTQSRTSVSVAAAISVVNRMLIDDDGEDSSVFTIKLHISGNLVWKPKVEYKDGFVEYFDHFNCEEGSLLDLRRMVKQLRFCDKKVQFWVKVKGRKNTRKIELRKVSTDAEILGLSLEVLANKELDLYVEHLYDDQWDYEVEISRSLGDDALLTEEEDDGNEQHSEREVDGPSTMFQEVDVEVNGPTSKQVENEGHVEIDEVDCVHSEKIFRSLDGSDSERECNASEFKWAVKYHEAMRRKDVKFIKNESRRVRTYNPEHTCGDQDENKTVNSGFLAKLYKDDFRVNMDWGRRQFQEHVKQKLHCQVSKHQAYRAKHKIKKELDGQDSDQFMLLYLMGRMQKNRDKMKTYPHKICPKISKCLEEAKDKSARYSTYKSHDNCYQVDDQNFKAFKVDLAQRQCSLQTYLRAYDPAILPIQSSDLWHKVDLPAPLPPKYKAQPGRPKKKRKIDPLQESRQQRSEVRTKKLGEVKRCRVCGLTGHNKTTCKAKNPQGSQEGVGPQSAPPLHNQVPHESTFIAAQGTTTATNATEELLRTTLQRLGRPTKIIVIKKKQ
nr:Myb/SANT-like DNA-binding domain protein [Ipomoea batatas]